MRLKLPRRTTSRREEQPTIITVLLASLFLALLSNRANLITVLCFSTTTPAATQMSKKQPPYSSMGQMQQDTTDEEVYTTATIDYSAANEFIAAHYGQDYLRNYIFSDDDENDGRKTYFVNNRVEEEPIYNARQMQAAADEKEENAGRFPSLLPQRGFTLWDRTEQNKHHIPGTTSATIDWTDLNSIRQHYLPMLRQGLQEAYSSTDSPHKILDILFWCPTLRLRERAEQTSREQTSINKVTPKAGYVVSAHIDTDVNAYATVEDFASLVGNNEFPLPDTRTTEQQQRTATSTRDVLADHIHQGRRFSIVNAWRNIGEHPIRTAPLAFCPSQYVTPKTAFPFGRPDDQRRKWYTFPGMTNNEILFFCQYDRDASYPSDLWHCALTGVTADDSTQPRESFDVRCLVLFDEVVPHDRDRLARKVPSQMTRRESQTFCAEQAEKRKRNT